MSAREAVLNDPRIVELLQTSFVSLGIDNAGNVNMTAAEKEFLADKGGRACTQGMAVFTAGGKVLGSGGGYTAEPNLKMLQTALEKYEPEQNVQHELPVTDEDRRNLPEPPEGGLVLNVTWKVLAGDRLQADAPSNDKTLSNALGVDRLWIRQDEAEELARGVLPESLRQRIARCHLDYVLDGKTKDLELDLQDGEITGTVLTDSGEKADLRGFLEVQEGQVTRFDLAVKGVGTQVADCGFSAGLQVVPKGKKVTVGVLLSLADQDRDLSRVMPRHARGAYYLK